MSLRRRVFVAVTVLVTLVAAAAGLLVASGAPPLAVVAGVAGVGLLLGPWLLGRALAPARQTLAALRDGVRGFHDHDFSLHIASTRQDELGEVVALYNALADSLFEQKSALLQKEILFDTILQATPIALLLANPRGRIVFANQAARQLLAGGRSLEGRSWEALLAACPEPLAVALGSGKDLLLPLEHEGEEETFHVARRGFEVNGQRHELHLLQRLTPELRRQEVAAWKRAIRTITHELNNSLAPVTSLSRSVRHLVRRPGSEERLNAALDVIEERSAHLMSFVEGYARFARLPEPVKTEVAWEPFLREVAELYSFRTAEPLPTQLGRFDREQIQQALINLLKNAVEAGGPPEEIVVAVERAGSGGIRLSVSDRGAGLSDDVLRKALLPFYTSKPGGTGLGLPLAREIAEAHGGQLRLERRQGGGTTVSLWLPGG